MAKPKIRPAQIAHESAADELPQLVSATGEVLPRTSHEAMRMHGGWLRAIAIARLKSTEGADDVMQEVAIAAMRNWSTLSSPDKAKPWLYRLTVRAALMYRRTIGRAKKRIVEAQGMHRLRFGATGGTETSRDPLTNLLRSERCAQLREAITLLPSKEVEMLILKHVEDASYQDIAQRMGVTVGVVQMRLFRARQKLLDIMLNQYGSEE